MKKLICLLIILLGFSLITYAEEKLDESVQKETQVAWYKDFVSEINILKGFDWKASLGGIVLRTGVGEYKVEGCAKFLETPKKYLSLNAIYPDIIGVSLMANVKKVGGDFWFRVCNRIDEEAREKLEKRYGFLKYIRIDVGYYWGYNRESDSWKRGWAFKVIEWNF